MRGRAMAAAGLLLCGAGAAAAQAPAAASAGERVLKSFTDCRAIAAPDARLACFDHAAGALESAVKARDVTIVDRQEVRRVRRSLFGFTMPRIALFGGGDDDDGNRNRKGVDLGFSEINTTIASASQVANSRVQITLADDDLGVWQTTDPVNFPPRGGTKIRIRKGMMGSYFMNFDGRTYRGMRLR